MRNSVYGSHDRTWEYPVLKCRWAKLCYNSQTELIVRCEDLVTELKLIQWVTIAPDGIRKIATTPRIIHQLKEGPIVGWSVVCPPPTTFLGLIDHPVALRLDNRRPGHQSLIPPMFTLVVFVVVPGDVAIHIGVPCEDVDGEQCDVPDCLHAKDKQHMLMT